MPNRIDAAQECDATKLIVVLQLVTKNVEKLF